jgi:hypothetical protein
MRRKNFTLIRTQITIMISKIKEKVRLKNWSDNRGNYSKELTLWNKNFNNQDIK